MCRRYGQFFAGRSIMLIVELCYNVVKVRRFKVIESNAVEQTIDYANVGQGTGNCRVKTGMKNEKKEHY